MTDTQTAARDIQGEIIKTVNQGQEAVLEAIRNWSEAVQALTPKLPVSLPFAEKLPKPEELVSGAYDFAEQLLHSQRKFAEEVVRATYPLLPAGEGTAPRSAKTGTPAK